MVIDLGARCTCAGMLNSEANLHLEETMNWEGVGGGVLLIQLQDVHVLNAQYSCIMSLDLWIMEFRIKHNVKLT